MSDSENESPKLSCPMCSVPTDAIEFRVRYIFENGQRHVSTRSWVLDCGHEILDDEVEFIFGYGTPEEEDSCDDCEDEEEEALEDWEVSEVWNSLVYKKDSLAVLSGQAKAGDVAFRWKDLHYTG